MPPKRKAKTDDQSDNGSGSTADKKVKVVERRPVSARNLKVTASLPNNTDGTLRFTVDSVKGGSLSDFKGAVALLSADSDGVPVFQHLTRLDPGTDAYNDLKKNYAFPSDVKEDTALYIDEDEDDTFFNTSRPLQETGDTQTLFLSEVHYDETRFTHVYFIPADSLPTPVLLAFKKEGGGGFGAARSDPPGDYVWFGNVALGYALGLDCSATHYLGIADAVSTIAKDHNGVPHGRIDLNAKTYYRTNTPQSVTRLNARTPTAGSQESEIIYYKAREQSLQTKVVSGETLYYRPDRTKSLYRRAPAAPVVPRIPDRTVRTRMDTSANNAQTTNSQTTDAQTGSQTTNTQASNTQSTNTQTTNTQATNTSTPSNTPQTNTQTASTGSGNTAPALPPKPFDLFDHAALKTGYSSYTKGSDQYTSSKLMAAFKEAFRKKAAMMTLHFSSGERDDTATEVYKAVQQPYQQSVNTYTVNWKTAHGQKPKDKHLPATTYCDYLIENFPDVRRELSDLSPNNPPANTGSNPNNNAPTSISTDQEWCHLFGHAGGGEDAYFNFVSGSHYANTEQLAVEMAQRQGKYPDLKVSVTAYRILDTDIARWIRYKIYHRDVKIFDHVFDGQSEGFDYHEYKILEATVRRVIAHAVSSVANYKDAEKTYAAKVNGRIAARQREEEKSGQPLVDQDGKRIPIYVYALPKPPQNANVNTATTANTSQQTNSNTASTPQQTSNATTNTSAQTN